jgi:hypothetical protein
MLRASTPLESVAELPKEVQLDVFGRRFPVLVEESNGLFSASSKLHGMTVSGYSREHALSNMHFSVVCLSHIEAKRHAS